MIQPSLVSLPFLSLGTDPIDLIDKRVSQMDYDKISGFFPMEWIMSGDFGWGFNKKKKRLAEEEAAKVNKKN